MSSDSILSAVYVRVLHGGVRGVGVAGGALLPGVPALGHAGAGRPHVGRCHHRPARVLLLRHRDEHCRAYIALCFC